MSSSQKGIDDLRDDDFDGLREEYSIFAELFFGCGCGSTTKRCLVTRAIVFEPELSKHDDTPLSSNSLQSAQASSKDCEARDDNAASDKWNGIIEPECFRETLSDDKNGKAKRLKLSIGLFEQSKVIDNGVSRPVTETSSKTITCRLVESSSGVVTSSSYLLNKPIGATKEGDNQEDSPTCQVSCSKDNNSIAVAITKSVASPISEESFAAKLLVAGPSVARIDQFTLPYPNGREKELTSHGSQLSNMPAGSKFMKDPRRLIQDEINNLLEATGWQFELQKRRNSRQRFSVYLSPEGKSFREFPKVWQLLGQKLLGKKFKLCQQTSGKHWTDIEQFCFDLTEALMHINISMDQCDFNKALADVWILLHPFVLVAFIEKKIGVLRKRNVVGATRGSSIDQHGKSEASLSLENPDVTGHKMALARRCDSHLTVETKSVVVEGNEGIDPDSIDMHGCRDISSDSHKGNNVYLGGHDRNFSCNYQLHCPNEIRLQADFYEHSVSNIASLPAFHDVSILQGKHGNMSSSLHACRLLQDGEKALPGTETVICNESSGDDVNTKKKMRQKSKKISEIKGSSLCRKNTFSLKSCATDEIHYTAQSTQPEVRDNQEIIGDIRSPIEGSVIINGCADLQDCKQVTESRKTKQQSDEKTSNEQMKDDDLSGSAILQKYSCLSDKDMSMKAAKPIYKRKLKSQRGRRRLQTLAVAKKRNFIDGKYIPMGPRTVLSWLVDIGAVSLNDVIQCRDVKYHVPVKDGIVTKDGIFCRCCNNVFSVSKFKMHAGCANQNHHFSNLFLENGKSYTTCLLQAWSADYKTRKTSRKLSQLEDLDSNDDTCGICGDGGDLICCDGCPSTFHQLCLATQDLPDGNWYCSRCICRICGDLVSNTSRNLHGLECRQCETKYHEACLKEMGLDDVVISETWFCGRNCEEVYSGLQARVGVTWDVSDGFSWMLLRCINDDQKIHSEKQLALKAECNSKLAVGLSIMEESFSAMSDPRTGIDMIPHMVYNCRSNFARLDFHGFYTVVLEKDDILTSMASISKWVLSKWEEGNSNQKITEGNVKFMLESALAQYFSAAHKIHGVMIAEMPMVATCSRYRRQGMCRLLMDAIEKMLISLKIEKLVISALPDLVDTWTSGFGFQPLEDYEKESLNSLNLMAFPGTILLKKPLYSCHTELKDYEEPWSTENYSGGAEPVTIFNQPNSYLDDREVEDDNPKSKQPNNDNFVAVSKEIESAAAIFQDNMQGKGIRVLKRDRSPE